MGRTRTEINPTGSMLPSEVIELDEQLGEMISEGQEQQEEQED